jgi:hypothetical protein
MPRYVEQLTIEELKLAFNEFLTETFTTDFIIKTKLWNSFWIKLKDKCSIVERF